VQFCHCSRYCLLHTHCEITVNHMEQKWPDTSPPHQDADRLRQSLETNVDRAIKQHNEFTTNHEKVLYPLKWSNFDIVRYDLYCVERRPE
jgi:hypothetical protein